MSHSRSMASALSARSRSLKARHALCGLKDGFRSPIKLVVIAVLSLLCGFLSLLQGDQAVETPRTPGQTGSTKIG